MRPVVDRNVIMLRMTVVGGGGVSFGAAVGGKMCTETDILDNKV